MFDSGPIKFPENCFHASSIEVRSRPLEQEKSPALGSVARSPPGSQHRPTQILRQGGGGYRHLGQFVSNNLWTWLGCGSCASTLQISQFLGPRSVVCGIMKNHFDSQYGLMKRTWTWCKKHHHPPLPQAWYLLGAAIQLQRGTWGTDPASNHAVLHNFGR